MNPADKIELDLLSWQGLLPDSKPQNSEPDYEQRLRKLGAALFAKKVEPADALSALCLAYLVAARQAEPKDRPLLLGDAKLLLQAAKGWKSISANADDIGAELAKDWPAEAEEPDE